MADSDERPTERPPKRGRRKRRMIWVLLGIFAVGLIVLNGPGWRWIAGKVADRYLPGLGLEGTVGFEGKLSTGEIVMRDVDLKGEGALREVKLDRIVLRYRLARVFRGEIESIRIEGLHADLDLERPWPESKSKTPNQPTDLAKLSETLRSLRHRVVPVEAEVSDLRVRITRGEEPVFNLASMDLKHPEGASRFELKLGELEFSGGRVLPAQQTAVVWNEESLALEKVQLIPGASIEGVQIGLPASGELSYQAAVLANAARFEANGSLENGQVRLASGTLTVDEVETMIGTPIPADGMLEGFELNVRDLRGGLATLDATVNTRLRDLAYEEWQVSMLDAQASLDGENLALNAALQAMGSPLEIVANGTLSRMRFQVERVEARVEVRDAAAVLSDVRERIPELKNPGDVPPSSARATASANFEAGRIVDTEGQLTLAPTVPETASDLDLDVKWSPGKPVHARLQAEGARISGRVDLEAGRYNGIAMFDEFTSDRLQAWLAAFAVEVPVGMRLTASWQGEGRFNSENQTGHTRIRDFTFVRSGEDPLTASGDITYDWPTRLRVRDLAASQGAQRIVGDATLEDQLLTLSQLQWTDGADVLLDGKASVPIGENPADWKALLKQTRPLMIDVESRELPLSKLHPFLAEDTRFPDSARGKVVLHVTGTPAEPVINGELSVRDLGLVSQDKVPKADLDLRMATSEGFFNVEGSLIMPGYPGADLNAKLPFRPGVWVQNPEVLNEEKLEASARVPNLDISRFAALAPGLRSLAGSLKADVVVGGTLGKPEPRGEVELKGGKVVLNDEEIPALEAITLKASATPAEIDVSALSLTMDGGTLNGSARLTLVEGKPGEVDASIRARSLPLKRDESMIVRAHADLGLHGPWETASLSGSVSVVDSLFYRDIELLPIGVPFNQPSAPSVPSVDVAKQEAVANAVPEPFRNWRLSVKVNTANAFLIRGNLATGQAILDVNVTGTVGSPEPRGQAIVRQVSAKLPFSTLVVEEGTATFQPEAPFDPVLNIRGRSVVRPYEVNVYVYGSVSDPEILTTSSPPLPESEIMTLLATGTTTRGIADPQAAMTRGAQLLIEELRRGRIRYARRLQPLLKVLDRVDFQVGEQNRYSGQKYNSATISLDDNWLISAGMGEEGNSRVTLMYLLRFR